jgi:Mlc titration factor MtfA (ptsG expression regulator)
MSLEQKVMGEMKEAMIWLQTTKDALVKIDYYAIDNPKEKFSSLFEYFFCFSDRFFSAAYSGIYLLFFLLPCHH